MRYAILLVLLGGCCTDRATLREGMDQGTRTIRSNELNWAEKLVAYPKGTIDPRTGKLSTGRNQADLITPLTPAEYSQDQQTHTDYDNLVANDRLKK